MESIIMNYSDQDEEDVFPSENAAESNHFTSRAPNSISNAMKEIVEIPESPQKILGTFGFPVVVRSLGVLKDAADNTNESPRNQIEHGDNIVVVSDEDNSNCDANDVISSIIISSVETVVDDQDYLVLCKSSPKATPPISPAFVEDGTNSECHNGSHISNKEFEENIKKNPMVATFPIPSSSLVEQGADWDMAIDSDNCCENPSVLSSPIIDTEGKESSKENLAAATLAISTSSLAGHRADTATTIDLDYGKNHSATSPISDKENENYKDAPTAATYPVLSTPLVGQNADTATAIGMETFNASPIGDKEVEKTDKGNSTAITSPISPMNNNKEDEESDNSTGVALPISTTRSLVDHGADSETAKDLDDVDKEYAIIIDEENSIAVTSPLASSPSIGQGAHTETAMDWIQMDWASSDTEDENYGKGRSTAATSPISSIHLADEETTMDSNESHSNEEDEESDKGNSTATTLPISTRSLLKCRTRKNIFECLECQYKTIDEKMFVKHQMDCGNIWPSSPRHQPKVSGGQSGKLEKDKQRGEINERSKQLHRCEYCSYSTEKKRNLKMHRRAHTVYNLPMYRCTKCDFMSTRKSLTQHLKVVHNTKFKDANVTPESQQLRGCDFCSYTTKNVLELKKHLPLHTVYNKLIYPCPKCDYKSTKQNLTQHVEEIHKIKFEVASSSAEAQQLRRCNLCSYTTTFSQKLSRHRQLHTILKKDNVSCTKCDYKAPQIALNFHYKSAHESQKNNSNQFTRTKYSCTFCSHSPKSQDGFEKHLLLHTVHNRPIYRCPKCDYKSTKSNFEKHVKIVHKIESKNISSLAKSGGLKKYKIESKNINSLAKKLYEQKCDFCSYTTTSNQQLMRHRQLHTVKNRAIVSCTKCDYKAPQIALNFHYKSGHESQKNNSNQLTRTKYSCTFCSHTSKSQDGFEKHLLLHTVHNRPIYRCSKCDYKSTKKNITKHVKTVHKIESKNISSLAESGGLKKYKIKSKNISSLSKAKRLEKCDFCSYTTTTNQQLMRHRQLHTVKNRAIVSCTKCDYKAPRHTLCFHYANAHGIELNKKGKAKPVLTCKGCSYTTDREAYLKKHHLLHTVNSRPIYHCPKCEYKSTKINLTKHLKAVHKITSIYTQGSKHCGTKYDYKAPEMDNPDQLTIIEYPCKFCSYTTKYEFYAKKHLLLHSVHNKPIYKCPKCDYKAVKMTLAKHVKNVHKIQSKGINPLEETEQVYTCKFCSHTSKREDDAKKHLLLHTVRNKPIYQCPKCDYKGVKMTLAKHAKAVHKIQSIGISSLEKTDVQMYTCKLCSYTSKLKASVKKHLRLHTVYNKPIYHCPKCDYKSTKLNLISHVKTVHKIQSIDINTVEKTQQVYTCKFCSFTTTHEGILQRHFLLHTVHNRPIYHCPKCDYKSTVMNLVKHVKTVHKIKSIDRNSLKKIEGLESTMIKHLEKTEGAYACMFCSFIAKHETTLNGHILLHTIHNRPIHNCDNCDYKSTKFNLDRHSCTHTGKQTVTLGKKNTLGATTEDVPKATKQFNNKECDTNENEGEQTLELPQKLESDPEYRCQLCSFSTEFKAYFSKHLRMHRAQNIYKEKPEYSCDFCSFTTPIDKCFNDHLDIHTEINEPLYSCGQCNYKSTKMDVARHSHIHGKEQRTSNQSNRRDLDTSEIEAEDTLKRSHKVVSMIKTEDQLEQSQYICDFCSFSTNFEPSLIRHLRLHTGEQTVALERKSPRRASPENSPNTVQQLKRTKLSNETHTSENERDEYVEQPEKFLPLTRTNEELSHPKYGCDLCSFTTNFEQDIDRHLHFHECEQIHSCSRCEYKSTKSNIAIHSSTVHGIKFGAAKPMYNCKVCSFSSEVRFIFEQHVQSHTEYEERINNSRVQLQNVTTHSRIVHGEKLVFEQQNEEKKVTIHPCQVCSFTTMFTGNLQRHLRSHSEDHEPRCNNIAKHSVISVTVQKSITKVDMAMYNCEFCSFTTDLAEAFKQHGRLHEMNRAAVKTEMPLLIKKRKPEDWEKHTETAKRSRIDKLPEFYPRNQIEDDDTIVVISDEENSNCDVNDVISSIIISRVETVVDDQDCLVVCKSSPKATPPISPTLVEDGTSTETAMDFDNSECHNGSHISNKEFGESDKDNSTVETFPIPSSSLVEQGADLDTGIDLDNFESDRVVSPISDKEDTERDEENSMAATLAISTSSLAGQKADTATTIDLDNGKNHSPTSPISDKENENDTDAPTATTFPVSSTSLIGQKADTPTAIDREKFNASPLGDKEDEETDNGNSTYITSPISPTPLVGPGSDTETRDLNNCENVSSDKENEESDNSTGVALPNTTTRSLVDHVADSEMVKDLDDGDKEHEITEKESSVVVTSPLASSPSIIGRRAHTETAIDSDNGLKEYAIIDQENSTAVTSPLASSPSIGQGAQKETAMDWIQKDWDNRDTEDSVSGKGNSTAVTSPISSTYLVGHGADAETTMDSNENLSNEEDEKSDEDDSCAATLPTVTTPLVGLAADTEGDMDSDSSDTDDEKSEKEDSIAATSPIPHAFLGGDGSDTETEVDSDNSESRSVSSMSDPEDEENDKQKSTAATLLGSTRSLVGQAVNAETATDSDYSENHSESFLSDKEEKESDKENSKVKNPLNSSNELSEGQFQAGNPDASASSQKYHDKPSSFKCELCSYSSTIRFGLKRHMLTHSENLDLNKIKCAHCPFETKSKKSLYHHWLATHKRSKCTNCDTFVTAHLKKDHLRKCKTKKMRCEYCSYSTEKKYHLKMHRRAHTVSKLPIYRCTKCDFKSTKGTLSRHLKVVHNTKLEDAHLSGETEQLSSCNFCSYTTKNILELKKHLPLHTVYNKLIYNCPKCDYKSTKHNLTQHVKEIHKIKFEVASSSTEAQQLRKCNLCSYTTTFSQKLSRHRQLHTILKKENVSCTKCDYKAPQIALNFHYKSAHESQKNNPNLLTKTKYSCTFCSHTPRSQVGLEKHLLLHTVLNRPIYRCPKCDYKSTKSNFEKHVKTVHKIESKTISSLAKTKGLEKDKIKSKNISSLSKAKGLEKCDFCSYTATTNQCLMRHRQLHTVKNIAIVSCTKCDYKAPRQALCFHYINVHGTQLNKEEKAKPVFTCKVCSYTTDSEAYLEKHNLLHTVHNRPIYYCPKCDYKSTKINIRKHAKTVHKIESVDTNSLKKTEGSKPSDTKAPQMNNPDQLTTTEYPCKFCSYTTKYEDYAKKHLLLHTVYNKPIYQCPKCDYKAVKVTLAKHVKVVHKISIDINSLKKTKGSKRCDNKSDYKAPQTALNSHLKSSHESQKEKPDQLTTMEHSCKFCSYTTKHEGNMNKHLLLHTVYNTPIYQCPKCDYKAVKVTLAKHVKAVHKISIDINFFKKTKGSKPCDNKGDYKAPQTAFNSHRKSPHESKKEKPDQLTTTEYPCKFCSHTTNNEDCLENHLRLHTLHNRPIYHCPKCDYKSLKLNLVKHVKAVHKIQSIDISSLEKTRRTYTCKFCSYTATTEDYLEKHLLLHTVHNRPIYQCPKCDYNSLKLNVAKHVKAVHKIQSIDINSLEKTSQTYTCKFCSYTTTNADYLEKHLLLHTVHNRPIYHCPKCDYKSTEVNLAKHVKTVHQIKSIDTNSFKKAEGLKSSMIKHGQLRNGHELLTDNTHQSEKAKKVHACKFCSFIAKNETSLKSHLVLHTVLNRPIHSCDNCDYKSTKYNLGRHSRTHAEKQAVTLGKKNTRGATTENVQRDSKQFKDKEFDTNKNEGENTLDRPHTKTKQQLAYSEYSCKLCSFSTEVEANLSKHLRMHTVQDIHKEKPEYSCDFCSFTTPIEKCLNDHLDIHTELNEPLHSCSQCNYRSTKLDVARHSRIHREEQRTSNQSNRRDLDTSKAENTLKRSHKLMSMMKTKEQLEQPQYICDFCSFSTNFEPSLIRHLRLHTEHNERIFTCSQCDYKSTERSLRQHARIHRGEQTVALERKSPRRSSPEDTQKTVQQLKRTKLSKETDTSENGGEEYVEESEKFVTMTRTSEELSYPKYGCDLCSFTTNFEQNLDRHLHFHDVQYEQIYSCSHCEYKSTKSNIAIHSSTVHGIKFGAYNCKVCSFSSEVPFIFEQHVQSHTEYEERINNSRVQLQNVTTHSRIVHREKLVFEEQNEQKKVTLLRCQLCSFTTMFNGNLQRHLRSHSVDQEPGCNCEQCHYNGFKKNVAKHSVTVQKSTTKVDMGIYNCKFCSFTTDLAEAFKQHGRLHEMNTAAVKTEMPLLSKKRKPEDWEKPTEIAKRSRVNKSPEINGSNDSSESFQVVHVPNNVLYVCEVCDYTTNRKQNLIGHKLAHLSTKTFEGNSLSSAQANSRTRPSNSSPKSGNFKCTTCKRCFTSSYAYRVHVCEEDTDEYTVHVKGDSVTFKCRKCSYQTMVKQNVKRHCRDVSHA